MKNSNPISAMSATPSTAVESSVSSPPRARRNVAAEAPVSNPLVAESLRELEDVDRTARDLGFESPSAEAKAAARKILLALAREFPRYYAVSPGDERDVSIQAFAEAGKGRGVLIVCDDEDIACYVTMRDENNIRHYDYSRVRALPDDFIRDAVRDLNSE